MLVATAAAIKAFPILVLGYLIYRRMWKAAAATIIALAAWLLLAPLPFRTPAQAVDDWSSGRRGWSSHTTPTGSPSAHFGRTVTRTSRSWRVAHRLLRDVPADGESVLARQGASRHFGFADVEGDASG